MRKINFKNGSARDGVLLVLSSTGSGQLFDIGRRDLQVASSYSQGGKSGRKVD